MKNILYILLLSGIISAGCNVKEEKNKNKDIYSSLEKILTERKNALITYMNETQKSARNICKDKNMVDFFKAEREFYYLKKQETLPQELTVQINKLHQNIQHHYIMNYQNFYDILFIDNRGEIFYTMLKQKDFGKNIFEGELAGTKLSKKLMNMPNESFVDFQFYEFSGEPSAFFIEPVVEGGKTIGWFVMQCAVNKINELFTMNKNIGSTGEVVLVNKGHYMLTNSRFSVTPTILKQQLPEENITWKFEKRKGRKNVVDYRGKEVFSVFEVFEFLNSEWLIIAKIDKSEVVTRKYLQNENRYFQVLKKSFQSSVGDLEKNPYSETISYTVDMDEYERNDTCGVIATRGVSTCTAVAINYPGKFSYLAHVSPYDVIYDQNRTDLLAQIFKKVLYFDITESEKQNLEFFIISTQLKSIKNATNKILDNGFFLSQIKFAFNKKARYGNVYSNCSDNRVIIEWIMKDDKSEISYINADSIDSFEQILLDRSTIL